MLSGWYVVDSPAPVRVFLNCYIAAKRIVSLEPFSAKAKVFNTNVGAKHNLLDWPTFSADGAVLLNRQDDVGPRCPSARVTAPLSWLQPHAISAKPQNYRRGRGKGFNYRIVAVDIRTTALVAGGDPIVVPLAALIGEPRHGTAGACSSRTWAATVLTQLGVVDWAVARNPSSLAREPVMADKGAGRVCRQDCTICLRRRSRCWPKISGQREYILAIHPHWQRSAPG